jgi:DNA-binding protein H-NS
MGEPWARVEHRCVRHSYPRTPAHGCQERGYDDGHPGDDVRLTLKYRFCRELRFHINRCQQKRVLERSVAKRAINSDRMAVEDLVELRADIEKALKRKIAVERKELQSRMDALAAFGNGTGRATHERTPGRRRGAQSAKAKVHPLKGRKAPPKYRGPNGETWAGRGVAPKWLTALEKKGKKRESFLIQV